jgi:exosortase/archaeosortase
MTNLGQLGWYLGINFTFTEEGIFLFQKPYIEGMLHMFGMAHCNLTKVLMVKGTRLIIDMNEQKVDATTYKKMVGKLIYLVILGHFSFSVLIMSRFLAEP